MSSYLATPQASKTLDSDRSPQIFPPVGSSAPRRQQLGRVLGWGFAVGAIFFAATTVYRGLRVIELRTLAIEASDALHAGQWQRLENICRRWQEKDPNAGMAWMLAAQAADKLESPGRMAAYIERMPDNEPNKAAALLDLATAYFGPLNQPSLGEAACLKSLQLDPKNVEARRRLVFYYCMTLQRTKLIEFARDAIATGNESPETYVYLIGADWITLSNSADYNGKWLQSPDTPENFLVAYLIHWAGTSGVDGVQDDDASLVGSTSSVDPQLQARIAAVIGYKSDQGNAIDHKQLLSRCMELYPQNSELIAFQLREASASGDVERVAKLLARVPESAAGDNRFFHYKGWLHEAMGENDEAIAAYREALRLNPFDWRSQLKLAGALRLVGVTDEADLLAALGIDGKDLRETILRLADVQSIPMPILEKLLVYSRRCGDDRVTSGLSNRIEMIRHASGRNS